MESNYLNKWNKKMLIFKLQTILYKYKDNPLKYFLPLSTALIDLISSDINGLYKYKNEFLKYLEDFEKNPLLHIKELSASICNKLNIEINNYETISSLIQKIINYCN